MPPVPYKPLCMYVCTIIIHIIYKWHAEARSVCVGGGGEKKIVYSCKTEKVGGVFSPFIHRNWLRSLLFQIIA